MPSWGFSCPALRGVPWRVGACRALTPARPAAASESVSHHACVKPTMVTRYGHAAWSRGMLQLAAEYTGTARRSIASCRLSRFDTSSPSCGIKICPGRSHVSVRVCQVQIHDAC